MHVTHLDDQMTRLAADLTNGIIQQTPSVPSHNSCTESRRALNVPGFVLRLDASAGCAFVVRPCQERRCLGDISTDLRLRTLEFGHEAQPIGYLLHSH